MVTNKNNRYCPVGENYGRRARAGAQKACARNKEKSQIFDSCDFRGGLIVSFEIPVFREPVPQAGIVENPRRGSTRARRRMAARDVHRLHGVLAVAPSGWDTLRLAARPQSYSGSGSSRRAAQTARNSRRNHPPVITFFYWKPHRIHQQPFGRAAILPRMPLIVRRHLYILKWYRVHMTIFLVSHNDNPQNHRRLSTLARESRSWLR